jgi:hypothetical protein
VGKAAKVTSGLYKAVIIIYEMRLSPLLLLCGLALALPACVSSPTGPAFANLVIEVTPTPVVVRLRCQPGNVPPCFVSLDPIVTLREIAGLGGRLETLDITVRDSASGAENKLSLGHDWIVGQAGTDRIEANGSVAFRPVIADYPISGTRPNFLLILAVRFVDDKSHVLTPSIQINVAAP